MSERGDEAVEAVPIVIWMLVAAVSDYCFPTESRSRKFSFGRMRN